MEKSMAGRLTREAAQARAAEIETMIAGGWSVNDLARHYGVTRVSMLKFLKRHDMRTNQQKEYTDDRRRALG